MRADLTARRQKYQGRSYWVVKEPVGLRYFRFQEEEFAVLNMLKGGVSLEDIKDRFEKDFAPHKITYQDLQQFIGTLHRSGLVISDAPGQGAQLKKRGDERNRKELLGKLSNILAVRFKGIDPDRILNVIYPFTRWLFTKTALVFFTALALSALLLIGVQFDVFRSRLPAFESFFGPQNWLYLGIVLAVTKIIHEFGHGLLCKHYGGECHEMGVMFLVLTPCLYCNVSDSWMLPNKYHRAAIGAGGIYFELIMASIATFIWWFTEPGMLNFLALRVMFICSISTVLFNGNPLLRFDGYYILADLIEIPNLRQKATKILQRAAGEYCLGLEMPEDPFLPQQNQFMFALYTVAAVAYRWFVFFSILFFLNQVFEPYGLKVLGQAIAAMGFFGLVIQPIWQLGKFMHVPGRMDQVKWHRLYITIGIVALVLGVGLFTPLPRYVKCSFEIRPHDPATVFLVVPGQLEEVAVKPGEHVDEGQLIARFTNSELLNEGRKLQYQREELKKQLDTLERIKYSDPDAAGQIPPVQSQLDATLELIDEKRAEFDKLEVRSPIAGTVLNPPLRFAKPESEGEPTEWTGSPFDAKNMGVAFEPTDVLCRVADLSQVEAHLAVDQVDLDFVRVGQKVWVKLRSATYEVLEGEISEISIRDMQFTPPSLTNQGGGELATRRTAAGVEVPLSATYQAKVVLENPNQYIRVGCRGRAKIKADPASLASRLWRYLKHTFHFYL